MSETAVTPSPAPRTVGSVSNDRIWVTVAVVDPALIAIVRTSARPDGLAN